MSNLEFHPGLISRNEVSVAVFHIVQHLVEHLSLAEAICDAGESKLDKYNLTNFQKTHL